MASYTFTLAAANSPAGPIHRGSECSLDTSVSGGKSYQRTGYFDVWNSTNRKVEIIKDNTAYTDTVATISDLDFIV